MTSPYHFGPVWMTSPYHVGPVWWTPLTADELARSAADRAGEEPARPAGHAEAVRLRRKRQRQARKAARKRGRR